MPLLSVVVPTLNEVENVEPLLQRISSVLSDIDWEIVFVDDDSTDGTANLVRKLAQKDARVRLVERIGRRGLSSACIEGMLASSAPYLAVMDGDLQHDESILPDMLKHIQQADCDLVIGSRNIAGGSMGEFSAQRQALSNWGRRLSESITKAKLSDPMSGFFMVDRKFLDITVRRMSGISFKVLVDLLASSPRPVRLVEVPYAFRLRERGDSKLDTGTLVEFAFLIADKICGRFFPVRFVLFAFSGASGLLVHLVILWLLYGIKGTTFFVAQSVAALLAMTVNFVANNYVTFADRRLKGVDLLRGAILFYVACSIGAITNIALATFSYDRGLPWALAGLFGTLVGAVWNYGVSSVLVWGRSVSRSGTER